MKIGNKVFELGKHTYIMGILNVTPDSFSDGGKYSQLARALEHVERMMVEGADIIDIGGESTRPGYTVLSAEEEIERVVPVIEAVKKNFDIPVALDTYKSQVARAGIAAGADMINDIWGLKHDDAMAAVIAESGLPCCLGHNRTAPYQSFMEEVMADLEETLKKAEQIGIVKEKIILDPGVGFGKNHENNLEIINRLGELEKLGCPLMLGTSRKSVIGLTLDQPVEERLVGTLVTTVLAVLGGCSFVRVHDVKDNQQAIRMVEAVRNSGGIKL